MVFIINLPVFIPACLKSPWIKLLGTVTRWEIFCNELLTPVLAGEGNFLYNDAAGWKIAPSKAWLNANVTLFIFSKQSFTSEGSFFFNINSPSDPALTFRVNAVSYTHLRAHET